MYNLNGKKYFVTGASRGIGHQIVMDLCAQGATVFFTHRQKEDEAQKLKQDFEKKGGSAHAIFLDLSSSEQITSTLNDFIKIEKKLDGIVNNAGISQDKLILRVKDSDIQTIMQVNLNASILITAILSRALLACENSSIVNISSVVGLMGNKAQSLYAASKAGLIGFTKSIAKELGGKKVRCNAICPGFIETEMTGALAEETIKQYLNAVPLEAFGTTQDVSNLVSFLLSDSSRYITGEVIKIDGGLYI